MTHPMRALRRRTGAAVTALVAGAVALSGCSVYDLPLPGGPDVGDEPILVTAKFRDVLDLVPQSTVKVNDVTVGKVAEVELDDYAATVTLSLPKDIDLPDNARAEIRQTSLLGEKFISLSEPATPSGDKLGNGDVIGLDSTGRNPEVEEVLGALGALLSGGGVGQLKLIAEELNTAMGGREDEIRLVIQQIRTFTGELARNKSSIIGAIENLNRLAVQLRKQDPAIKAALDDLPAALESIDKQRGDLVKVLKALQRLSGVGVDVIRASKQSTINSLRDLAPVLTAFADAGQDLPRSLQVYLTYPFVDEAVGRDPQVARNLHMGDYTNLSVRLNLDLSNPPNLPGLPDDVVQQCRAARAQLKQGANQAINQLPLTKAQKDRVRKQVHQRIDAVDCDALGSLNLTRLIRSAVRGLVGVDVPLPDLDDVVKNLPKLPVGGGSSSGGGGVLGGLGLGRAGLGADYRIDARDPLNLRANGYDPGVGTLLLQGLLGGEEGDR